MSSVKTIKYLMIYNAVILSFMAGWTLHHRHAHHNEYIPIFSQAYEIAVNCINLSDCVWEFK